MNPQALNPALESLRRGGVIGYATEAVFGLGCDPDNGESVRRLLEIKQRPVEKGLVLIAADFSQLLPYLDLAALPPGRLAGGHAVHKERRRLRHAAALLRPGAQLEPGGHAQRADTLRAMGICRPAPRQLANALHDEP